MITKKRSIHGYYRHKLYAVWACIVNRCLNTKSTPYPDYGGRGITFHAEWREEPGVFIEWCLANGWKDGLTIERDNVNGNYEPGNCSFIPNNMQGKNTRRSYKILYNGKTYTQRGLAKELGMHEATFRDRYVRGQLNPIITEALKNRTKIKP